MWWVPVYAAMAMFFQDIFGIFLVQAEARNKAVLSGTFDVVQWLGQIAVTYFAVDTLFTGNIARTAIMLAAVSAANFVSSLVGVPIGAKYIKSSE